MTQRLMIALLPLLSASLFVSSCGSKDMTMTSPECTALSGYTPTSPNAISFATDIMPLLLDTGTVNPIASPGCSTATICHNATSPIALDPTGVKHLAFTDATTTLAALMMDSVNAPGMKRVAPGSVANSFMAYKLSGAKGLACVNSMCVPGASVGTSHPCGDPMPTSTTGVLTDAQKTKILDWIALGANP